MMDSFVYALARGFFRIVRRMPLGACFSLGRALGLVLWAVLPGYRKLAAANIAGAFPDLTAREAAALARRHFMNLGANGLCAVKIPSLDSDEISRVARIDGLDHIRREIARARGVVLAINHIGNWELYAQLVYRVPEARFGTVYQALRNARLDELVNRDRRRLGVLTFDRKKGFNAALGLINEPGILGVLVDQNAGDGGMWTPFFGRLASTSTLAATLAHRTGAAVIPCAIFTDGFAKWRVAVSPPIDSPEDTVQRLTWKINKALEEQIRESPADWFWVHNRWKMPHPNFLTATQKRGHYLPPEVPALRPFRIVVRSPNWLGDAVMAIPAARAFKTGRPDARLAVLAPEKLAALWSAVPEVDEVIPFAKGDGLLRVAGRLRNRFDVAVLFPNSLRSAAEAWLAGVPRRVGYDGHFRSRLLNQIIRPKKSKKVARPLHHADRYAAIAEMCGGIIPPAPPRLWNPPAGGGPPVFAVCPGAEFGPAKRWPAASFRAAMEICSKETGCRWVIFGAAGDASVAGEIARDFPGEIENRVGKTSLEELIDGLRGVHALLTNDTGTMHLADALGVPLVAVFGSTEPALTGPRGPASRVIRHQVECSPCYLRKCPIDFRCMKAVTPESVAATFLAHWRGFCGGKPEASA